jgi:hypothetical protein
MPYFSSSVSPVAIASAHDRATRIAPCAIYALYCVAALFALFIAGCATTHLDSQWMNPDFAGRKLTGKLLVVGVSRDDTVRRLYEDEMSAQLALHKTDTARSYELIAGPLVSNGPDALMQAARNANANLILTSVVVSREHVDRVVSQSMPLMGSNFDGWYGHYWPYAYVRTEVHSFYRYTVITSLSDAATGKIMWSASTQTEDVDRVDREIKAFAKVIIKALSNANLL